MCYLLGYKDTKFLAHIQMVLYICCMIKIRKEKLNYNYPPQIGKGIWEQINMDEVGQYDFNSLPIKDMEAALKALRDVTAP